MWSFTGGIGDLSRGHRPFITRRRPFITSMPAFYHAGVPCSFLCGGWCGWLCGDGAREGFCLFWVFARATQGYAAVRFWIFMVGMCPGLTGITYDSVSYGVFAAATRTDRQDKQLSGGLLVLSAASFAFLLTSSYASATCLVLCTSDSTFALQDSTEDLLASCSYVCLRTDSLKMVAFPFVAVLSGMSPLFCVGF